MAKSKRKVASKTVLKLPDLGTLRVDKVLSKTWAGSGTYDDGSTSCASVGGSVTHVKQASFLFENRNKAPGLFFETPFLQANDNEQALGTRKVGGRHSARGRAIGKQINFDPLGSARGNLIGPKMDPDCFWWVCVNHSKQWRGRRDSNPRPLP